MVAEGQWVSRWICLSNSFIFHASHLKTLEKEKEVRFGLYWEEKVSFGLSYKEKKVRIILKRKD